MNYEEMSDFELSCEVMYAIHGEHIKNWCLSDCETYIYDCGSIGEDFHKIDVFDINNPADMWPIILENKITTEWCFDDDWRATVDNQFQAGAFNRFQSFSKNPLRAAAIVFLKMKDAEKSNK